jgi:hypothetical protein
MAKKSNPRAAVAHKIQRLQDVADALATGSERFFFINRLTVIKSLSAPADAATAFALDLARRTVAQMRESPEHVPHELKLARQAVQAIRAYHRTISDESVGDARALWHTIQAAQNEIVRPLGKYPVRVIRSMKLLVIEDALGCAAFPESASDYAYRAARFYCERYNPRYGTGIVPESLPFLQDVIRFWKEYYGLEPQ